MTKEEKLQEIKDKIFKLGLDYYELMWHQPADFHISIEEYNKRLEDLKLDEGYRFQDYADVRDDMESEEILNFDDYSWIE